MLDEISPRHIEPSKNERRLAEKTQLRRAVSGLHSLLTRGESVPYACRRGVAGFEGGVPSLFLDARSRSWVRVKDSRNGAQRDRWLGARDVTEHVRGKAEYAVQLPEMTNLFCLDLDLHPERVGYDKISDMTIRLKEVAYHTVRWIQLSGGDPLVMTSPGLGYHIWGSVDRLMQRDILKAALQADYADYMATVGCSPLGDGASDSGVGTDWYPTRAMIRIPGGRGQLILDPRTLRPDKRYGGVGSDGKRRRKILESVQRIWHVLAKGARIKTDPSMVVSKPSGEVSAGIEVDDRQDERHGSRKWADIVNLVRKRDLERGLVDKDESELVATGSGRWVGTTIFESTGPTRPLATGSDEPYGQEMWSVGHGVVGSIIETATSPVATPLQADGTVQAVQTVCLDQPIRRGPEFTALLEAAEEYGIVLKTSTGEYSAARKLAWRARSLGISTTRELAQYLKPILAKSQLPVKSRSTIEKEAGKAFGEFSHVQSMQAQSASQSKSQGRAQRKDRKWPNRLETDAGVPSELAGILANVPGISWVGGAGEENGLADDAALTLSLLAADTDGLETTELDAALGDRRVAGTRKRVSAVVRRALVGHQLVKRSAYIAGVKRASYRLTSAGWAVVLVSQLRSAECRVVDLTSVPAELLRDVRAHVYRLGGGELFERVSVERLDQEISNAGLTAGSSHARLVTSVENNQQTQQQTGPPI